MLSETEPSTFAIISHLVLLLEFHERGKLDQGTFHAVETFDNDQNLLPRPVRLGLALADDLSQKRLEGLHVVVLEHPDVGAAETNTEPDRRMVELVRDDEAALGHERGDDRRVRREERRLARLGACPANPEREDWRLVRSLRGRALW